VTGNGSRSIGSCAPGAQLVSDERNARFIKVMFWPARQHECPRILHSQAGCGQFAPPAAR
jgi:hypothetical protein